MKATELMIGNWVAHKDYPDIGIQVIGLQVKDIAIDRIYLRHSLLWDGSKRQYERIERNSDAEIFDIVPIPLTPEILEKNGFVNVYRGRYRFDDNKGSIVEISTINGLIKWVRVSKYDSDDIEDTLAHFTSYEIKHLHELQNALTLCKIEKEIEL